MPALDFAPICHPGLILDRQELDAARAKVAAEPWARAAFDCLIASADEWLARDIVLPDQQGQWPHYYACEGDGSRLQRISATRHRCPACDRIYTGDKYDRVVVADRHNALGKAALDLGLAYQLTRNAKYLQPARKILLGYADRYLAFPLVDRTGKPNTGVAGRVHATNLCEAVWLVNICWTYDLVADALSETERTHICRDMLLPGGREVLRRDVGIHNIRCWMNAAAGLAAICGHDSGLAYRAIRAELGLEDQLARGILDDGFWFEASWGYHLYTMQALWPLAEAARHIGVDVYNDRYKSFYDAPLDFAFPGLRLPALNDSGSSRTICNAEAYEIAYARWGDPRHAGLLALRDRRDRLALCFGEQTLDGVPPAATHSTDFPASGVAILRDGADDPTVVSLDYGPHGGFHGHPDKLGIILYGAGREWAPDPGSIRYGAPLHLEWFKTTLSHNTVLVDRQAQQPCTGKRRVFDIREDIRIASASADDAYPGVRFRRTVALLDGGVVFDLVQLDGESPHTFDWVFHCKGAFASALPFEPLAASLGAEHGYQHVDDPRVAQADSAWSAVWTLEGAGVALVQAACPGTEILTGTGPGNPPAERLPLVASRRTGRSATFASAFVVRRGPPPALALHVDVSSDSARFQLTMDDAHRTVDLPCDSSMRG